MDDIFPLSLNPQAPNGDCDTRCWMSIQVKVVEKEMTSKIYFNKSRFYQFGTSLYFLRSAGLRHQDNFEAKFRFLNQSAFVGAWMPPTRNIPLQFSIIDNDYPTSTTQHEPPRCRPTDFSTDVAIRFVPSRLFPGLGSFLQR
jgi:hypothetical protein